ncbi:hypothetical protein BH10CYA1_BH10CYA1_26770 [soil metagenome]
MSKSDVHKILFLSQEQEESNEAETIFRIEAEKSELSWIAMSGAAGQASDNQNQADLIVILEHAEHPHSPPQSKVPIEVWKISTAQEVSTVLKQNISNLVVRLILKGGKRQPISTPEIIASNTSSATKAAAQAAVRVGMESKGRGGKKVSVISGLPLNDTELDHLTTKLKRTCGTGGTFKDGQIEIQGDHRDKLMAELQKLGYKPKRKGG